MLNPLLPDIWIWSVFSEEKGFYFNGYTVQTPNGLLIIDPPSATEDVLEALHQIGEPTLVVVTNRDHERTSHLFRQHFHIPVIAHELDAPLLVEKPERTFKAGDDIVGGFQVVHLDHQKSPGESALYSKSKGLLIMGDALIGHPAGALSMLPAEKYADPQRAYESLKQLADLHPGLSTLLTGDGEPILENAQDALELFFVKNMPVLTVKP